MYKLYYAFCQEEKHDNKWRKGFIGIFFNIEFNFSFKRSSTDTCDKCDKLHIKITHDEAEVKAQVQVEKKLQPHKAEAAKSVKDKCQELKYDSQVAIIFDLQKTMSTPYVSTFRAYYYKLLWAYNLGSIVKIFFFLNEQPTSVCGMKVRLPVAVKQ